MTNRTPVMFVIYVMLTAGLGACRSRDGYDAAPAAKPDAIAVPVLASSTQVDLARDLDDAERHGTFGELRHKWQGQHVRWTVTRYRALCATVDACHVAAFPIQRPAQHGWLPALELAPGELAKLDTACGDAERCELTFDGTLKELAVSAEMPTSMRFGDVHVVAAHV